MIECHYSTLNELTSVIITLHTRTEHKFDLQKWGGHAFFVHVIATLWSRFKHCVRSHCNNHCTVSILLQRRRTQPESPSALSFLFEHADQC